MRFLPGLILLLFFVELLAGFCQAGEIIPEIIPFSNPEEQGLDSQLLVEMLQRIQQEQISVRSLIVVRNGRLVLESYSFPYNRDTTHNTKSVSKSFISALVGIALGDKLLPGLDQRIDAIYPRYFDKDSEQLKRSITLRQLLMMVSGLKISDESSDTELIYASPDPLRTMLSFPVAGELWNKFNYLTPQVLMLAKILEHSSGKALPDLADSMLFSRLGINKVFWKEVPPGCHFTDAYLRPIDMAKFGMLFLQNGQWEGRKIVPPEWVEESTKKQVETGTGPVDSYGYLWWVDTSRNAFMAMGWGGQGIFVLPKEKSVIVTTAAHFGAALTMVFRYIIPAIKSEKPLPRNQVAFEKLQILSRALQEPQSGQVAEMPEMAKNVSGKKYILQPNPAAILSLRFDYAGGKCLLELGTEKGESLVEVGLDGVYRVSDCGNYGERPSGNRIALRGNWKSADTFFLDFHQVGRPEQALMELRFSGDELMIDVVLVGTEVKFQIPGKLAMK